MAVVFVYDLSIDGLKHGKRRAVRPPFKMFEFERSFDNELFYNVHRIDKPSFHASHNATLPSLRSKFKRPDLVRMPFQRMLSVTLSYLGWSPFL